MKHALTISYEICYIEPGDMAGGGNVPETRKTVILHWELNYELNLRFKKKNMIRLWSY